MNPTELGSKIVEIAEATGWNLHFVYDAEGIAGVFIAPQDVLDRYMPPVNMTVDVGEGPVDVVVQRPSLRVVK